MIRLAWPIGGLPNNERRANAAAPDANRAPSSPSALFGRRPSSPAIMTTMMGINDGWGLEYHHMPYIRRSDEPSERMTTKVLATKGVVATRAQKSAGAMA